ncbi:MAG: hypothetical protein ACRDRH_09370 [Pseudonocardia sp.]
MSTHRHRRPHPDQTPTTQEIADLTARLRTLTTPGHTPDPTERAAFLTDKTALLARIPTHDHDQDGQR